MQSNGDQDGDNYQEDTVEIRTDVEVVASDLLVLKLPQSVAKSDVAKSRQKTSTEEVAPAGQPDRGESAMVPVPREQLLQLRRYYAAVKDAYCTFSLTDGDCAEVVRRLFELTPELLCSADRQGRGPIEAAMAQGSWTASARLLELAGRRNPRALRRRTAAGRDALMLAVSGGHEGTVRTLLRDLGRGREACLHYDSAGRSSLHLCAMGDSDRVLELLLADLAELLDAGRLAPDCVAAAFATADCDGLAPLHYMARQNRARMLRLVHEFSAGGPRRPRLDWDVRQVAPDCHRRLTPLAAAAEADALEACEFLLRYGLAGVDLNEHLDVWSRVEFSKAARSLLGQHCPLLEPMSALPAGNLAQLQAALRERGHTEEFLLKLRTRWPDLPQLPTVVSALAVCQNLSGSCRLAVWDILTGLGTGDLARLLEG